MLETQETTKMSRGKKLLFSLITIFILWLFFDTAAYILIQKLQNIYSIFYGFQPATDEYLEAYKKHFHPRWGWDIPKNRQGQLGNRKSREYEKKDEYTMKVFGDSFAYSTGDDNETFESMIEEKTGWECLNYGVGGYGTDQALLKYKDNTIKTKYTLLCIMDEDMGRCMNICRGLFYNIGEGLQPKPRFAISDVNSIRLINNPENLFNVISLILVIYLCKTNI